VNLSFSRYTMRFGKTLAYRRFQQHHTELNSLYWTNFPVSCFASYLIRKSVGATPQTIFHASGPDLRRIPASVEDFKTCYSDFNNWNRLNALMSASSYFEIYLRSIVTLALLSDPGVRHNQSRKIDGMLLYKYGLIDDYEDEIRSCIIGMWPKRISSLIKLFQYIPIELKEAVSELEKIRKIRNGVGHSFGREINSFSDVFSIDNPKMTRISHERLKSWLELFDSISVGLDQYFGQKLIGDFEILVNLHNWKKKPILAKERGVSEDRRFQKFLNSMEIGEPVSKKYCTGLISYYSSL